jgi:hypothetical protein
VNQPQPNQPGRRSRGRGRGGQNQRNRRPKPATRSDIWTTPEELPPVEPIVIPNGVDALIRSMGDGPAIGASTVLDRYVVAVVERTAAVAAALAFSADVLANADE